jgi:hypothetical protein
MDFVDKRLCIAAEVRVSPPIGPVYAGADRKTYSDKYEPHNVKVEVKVGGSDNPFTW